MPTFDTPLKTFLFVQNDTSAQYVSPEASDLEGNSFSFSFKDVPDFIEVANKSNYFVLKVKPNVEIEPGFYSLKVSINDHMSTTVPQENGMVVMVALVPDVMVPFVPAVGSFI